MAIDVPHTWLWAFIGVAWVGAALHTAVAMRRYGRRAWVWFVISLFCTFVPAAIVSYVDYFRLVRKANADRGRARRARQCPHCGAQLTARDLRRAGDSYVCPNCRRPVDEPGDG